MISPEVDDIKNLNEICFYTIVNHLDKIKEDTSLRWARFVIQNEFPS